MDEDAVVPIRWAVIGFGSFSDLAMAPAIASTPGHTLAAICGRDLKRMKNFAEKYEVPRYTDSVDDLLERNQLDAVYIATPNFQHAELTVRAAEHGLHVLCEKPIAVNVTEGKRMVDSCRRGGVRLMIGNMMRFNPCHAWGRSLIVSGKLGNITVAQSKFGVNLAELYDLNTSPWRLDPALSGGGALMDVGVHTVNLLRYLVGREVLEVTAMIDTRSSRFPIDWNSMVILRFDGGALATVHSSFDNRFQENDFQIRGTEGCLEFYGTLWRQSVGTARVVTDQGICSFQPAAGSPSPYALEIEHFAECIRSGRDPLVSGEDGLRDLDVCLCSYESARLGRTVRTTG